MKKFMKHVVPLLLVVCLVVALGCTAFASGDLPFTDVPENSWYYVYVNTVYEEGFMNGTSATTFSPQGTMTRGMLITVLYRMATFGEEFETDYPSAGFFDVDPDIWYAEAVDWGVYYGIVKGTGGRYFSPDDPITREQAATFFLRTASQLPLEDGSQIPLDNGMRADLNDFPDANNVHDYAVEALQWAVANDIITGTTNDYNEVILAPRDSATRAQLAAIVTRFALYLYDLLPAS